MRRRYQTSTVISAITEWKNSEIIEGNGRCQSQPADNHGQVFSLRHRAHFKRLPPWKFSHPFTRKFLAIMDLDDDDLAGMLTVLVILRRRAL
jgi:hypothetical protein